MINKKKYFFIFGILILIILLPIYIISDTNSNEEIYQKAEEYFREGNYQAAVGELEQVISSSELAEDKKLYQNFIYLTGESHLHLENYAKAEIYFNQLLDQTSSKIRNYSYFNLAFIETFKGDYETSNKVLDKINQQNIENKLLCEIYYLKARNYYYLNDTETAIRYLKSIINNFQGLPKYFDAKVLYDILTDTLSGSKGNVNSKNSGKSDTSNTNTNAKTTSSYTGTRKAYDGDLRYIFEKKDVEVEDDSDYYDASLARRRRQLSLLEEQAASKIIELDEKERKLNIAYKKLKEKATQISQEAKSIKQKQEELEKKATELAEQEKEILKKQKEVEELLETASNVNPNSNSTETNTENANNTNTNSSNSTETGTGLSKEELEEKLKDIEEREQTVAEMLDYVKEKKAELAKKEESLNEKEAELKKLETKEKELAEKEIELNKMQSDLEAKEKELTEEEDALDDMKKMVNQQKSLLEDLITKLQEKEKIIDEILKAYE